jgi:hypothetical protein
VRPKCPKAGLLVDRLPQIEISMMPLGVSEVLTNELGDLPVSNLAVHYVSTITETGSAFDG